ncbi:MAG: glycoside hydrolase family 2, partial [Eggerthellaceae bacterium]|nr:glycoside hydrolase family 2 [Eggerthellaceae bacterium]
MLNLKKVLGAKPKEHVDAQLATMYTPQGEALDPLHVWEEHPDPQLEREQFETLNGRWACAFVAGGHEPTDDLAAVCAAAPIPDASVFQQAIVVPFSPEAPLSRVNRQLQPDEFLWYRRSIPCPELGADHRCILHFQAVDYACAVRVNGRLAGTHVGGYIPFAFDITDLLEAGENQIDVCVADPSEFGGQPRGKQRFDRGDIWYTAQSGIWQAVWFEIVPPVYIERLLVDADPVTGIVAVAASVRETPSDAKRAGRHARHARHGQQEAGAHTIHVEVYDDEGDLVGEGRDGAIVESPRLWSPDDPYLYELVITCDEDVVHSYCGFRKVEMRCDEVGHARVFLNGEPLFVRGVLDQAYWPDGLMTAPSDEALVFDIEAMRNAGFNLMRMHIKVENARWYYHCDRLGMLVMQDMVQGGTPEIRTWDWSYKPTLFKLSWNHFNDEAPDHQEKLGAGAQAYRDEWTRTCRETVQLLENHPSIIGWSLFNEGWGQFDARAATELVRALDPTRVIDAVSGWYDQGCGDFKSVHNYFRELAVWPCSRGRAFFISEFGGFSHRVEGHSSLPECYGYEIYDDIATWRAAVRALIAHVEALEPKGLAGYIYTQVSDIEEETNGLLTYDRRINK